MKVRIYNFLVRVVVIGGFLLIGYLGISSQMSAETTSVAPMSEADFGIGMAFVAVGFAIIAAVVSVILWRSGLRTWKESPNPGIRQRGLPEYTTFTNDQDDTVLYIPRS